MGHVDHGKTSLLDAIRETEVVAGEAGGITQHIGAYQVHQNGKTISFIDTPGHAAFTAMRARGADVTDIVVIVVAADDGVMPQTVEAIDHAKAADVPMLVAINKIDLPDANPDKVKGELATQGLNPEDWGGDTIFVNVSAKTKENLDELLESILLLAEVEELQGQPRRARLGLGDRVAPRSRAAARSRRCSSSAARCTSATRSSPGPQWGKVRAMQDHTGTRLEEARPGDPVEVLGFEGVCEAGERVEVVENDRRARQLAEERAHRLKTEQLARRQSRRLTPRRGLREGARGRAQRAQHRAQGRRLGLARGASGRDREAAAGRDRGQRDPRRRRRDQRVRRDARRRLRRGDHRLQRPPARRRPPRRRAGGRRDPHLLGDLQGDRGAARGDGGHARSPRRSRRRSARPRCWSCSRPRGSARSPAARVTDGKVMPRRRGAPGPRRHRRLDRPDRLAAPVQGRRRRGRGRARVRDRARGLPGRQGRRRARGRSRRARSRRRWSSRARPRRGSARRRSHARWRPAAYAWGVPTYVCLLEIQLDLRHAAVAEGEAQGGQLAEGAAAPALRRRGRRDRRPRRPAAGDAAGARWSAARRSAGAPTRSSASSRRAARTAAGSIATCVTLADIRG